MTIVKPAFNAGARAKSVVLGTKNVALGTGSFVANVAKSFALGFKGAQYKALSAKN